MRYDDKAKEIVLNRELSNLDKLVLNFIKILEKYTDYVIVSGYVSIILGRARATEDVDVFIEKIDKSKFLSLYKELQEKGFWCINGESGDEVFSYLENKMAVRFARKNEAIPNFEIKFPKTRLDEETFEDSVTVVLKKGKIKISSLERQVAFKRYFLKSDKDVEDAIHIEELFKDKLDYGKINKLKERIKGEENG